MDYFQFIILVKMLVSIVMVVLLSVLAELVSPRFAGVLSGYPLGAAISLFFFGYELSPEFAADSAVYTCVGLVATQAFAYLYYQVSIRAGRLDKPQNIMLASSMSLCGYFLVAVTLRPLEPNLLLAVTLPAASIVLFVALFKRVDNVRIRQRVALNPQVLFMRSLAAAFFIVVITSTAKWVGPSWAGLFSAFPVTMLPLVVIIHVTYDPEHVYAILKNVPKGIGSLIVYSVAVHLLYPAYGIYLGTLLAYLLATLYLVLLHVKGGAPRLLSTLQSRTTRSS
ncbi:hypothetical protein [Desulfoferrobacter suflitae]|uniref:hypothetical protein n=1 Tax=Desulfoferrobacter suflitae TaxID=2865782 RepID=UPI00216413E5|nr:hypothetical protein [Desulfoferrobacter suflitae]MCK8601411.1 hypothetical protein [Desulfoferrobacter suflitae]